MTGHLRSLAFACLLSMIVAGGNPAWADEARRILDETGVRGGLVVHVGCGDGKLTAALHASDRYLVHGIDTEAGAVARARAHVQSLGLYGPVSIDRFDGLRLPYADSLVNLIVAEDLDRVPMTEVMRVLAPRGVACLKRAGTWTTTVKPWPDEIDEWSHWLHSPDGNAVARDRVVGPPRRLQWMAEPLWSRHHDTVPSTSAMVSSQGRLFYIADEAPACIDGRLPDKWFLVARDAFNGVLLWKRPMPEWGWRQWAAEWLGRFNIPIHLPKRLVAASDRLFVTLGFNAPLTALDAATGEVLHVYEGTEHTDEILYRDGLLILSLNHEARRPDKDNKEPVKKSVCVVEADSGKILWKRGTFVGLKAKFSSAEPFGRLELAVGDDQVFLVDHDALVSLDLESGRERWRVPRPDFDEHFVGYGIRMSDQCVLVYQDGVVLFAQPEMKRKRSWHTLPGTLHAYRAEDGEFLWKHQYGGWSHNWQPDVFVVDGLVWVHEHVDVPFEGHEIKDKKDVDYAVIGLDLKSGELERRFSTKESFDVGHHHRCYRGKATERFLLASRRGVEFLDLATEENHLHHWARAACLHGFVPSNGLLYLSPHPCECYIATKLNGYFALAPEGRAGSGKRKAEGDAPRLEKGPAYEGFRNRGSGARGQGPGVGGDERAVRGSPKRAVRGSPNPAHHDDRRSPASGTTRPVTSAASAKPRSAKAVDHQSSILNPQSSDWPTFRHDAARSGATSASIPTELETCWQTTVGERISPPVVAGGKVLLASIDEHRVLALDAAGGDQLWSFTAGGRVDTPPTIHRRLVLFGSADGWVYCLRESDGQLVWRRRAAPRQQLVGALGQLESAWPVHGSVLVQNDVAYVAAGRSSYLDGGIFLYALDPTSGDVLVNRVLYSPDPETGEGPPGDARTIPGTLTDVLVGDGATVYMRGQKVFGEEPGRQRPLFSTAGLRDDTWFNRTRWAVGAVPHAQLLVFDDELAYGVAAYSAAGRNQFFYPGKGGYLLFAGPWRASKPDRRAAAPKGKSKKGRSREFRWATRVPLRVTALAVAGPTLLAAGPPDVVDPQDPLGSFEGRKGAALWLLSAADGEKLVEYRLDSPPVFDGLAAANGRLVVSLNNGTVLCMGPRD